MNQQHHRPRPDWYLVRFTTKKNVQHSNLDSIVVYHDDAKRRVRSLSASPWCDEAWIEGLTDREFLAWLWSHEESERNDLIVEYIANGGLIDPDSLEGRLDLPVGIVSACFKFRFGCYEDDDSRHDFVIRDGLAEEQWAEAVIAGFEAEYARHCDVAGAIAPAPADSAEEGRVA